MQLVWYREKGYLNHVVIWTHSFDRWARAHGIEVPLPGGRWWLERQLGFYGADILILRSKEKRAYIEVKNSLRRPTTVFFSLAQLRKMAEPDSIYYIALAVQGKVETCNVQFGFYFVSQKLKEGARRVLELLDNRLSEIDEKIRQEMPGWHLDQSLFKVTFFVPLYDKLMRMEDFIRHLNWILSD